MILDWILKEWYLYEWLNFTKFVIQDGMHWNDIFLQFFVDVPKVEIQCNEWIIN